MVQLYRTRKNQDYCKECGIHIPGPKPGRPSGDHKTTKQERSGAGLIMTKLEDTTLASIALSVYVTNLFAVPCIPDFLLYFWDSGKDYGAQYYIQILSAAGSRFKSQERTIGLLPNY